MKNLSKPSLPNLLHFFFTVLYLFMQEKLESRPLYVASKSKYTLKRLSEISAQSAHMVGLH